MSKRTASYLHANDFIILILSWIVFHFCPQEKTEKGVGVRVIKYFIGNVLVILVVVCEV